MSRNATAADAGRLFFPQARALGIDESSYSPAVLEKIVYAGTKHPSFAQGSEALRALAEMTVPTKQVERISEAMGRERVEQRDQAVRDFLALPLAKRCGSPIPNPPKLAVVEMDGGRLQIRENGRRDVPPAEPRTVEGERLTASDGLESDSPNSNDVGAEDCSESGERNGHWREDKIGLLMTMKSEVSETDPVPEIPRHFVDPLRILKLAREIKGGVVVSEPDLAKPGETLADKSKQDPPSRPRPLVRTTVATRRPAKQFGEILAQAAWSRGFMSAVRKAFVGDGASTNWTVHKRWFSDFTPILDFIHALSYIFASAMAGRAFRDGWDVYADWIQRVWSGRVEKVIEALAARQSELGEPEKGDKENSPRRVVAEALTYLRNNKERMRYDSYRKAGLPITSSHMESTVKLFNRRLKGTEKFWSEQGAESILQLRADFLSETDPLDAFWEERQANASGKRKYRRAS
jgi:hypothetical protein